MVDDGDVTRLLQDMSDGSEEAAGRLSGALRRQGLLDELDAAGMPGTHRKWVGQGSGGFSVDASVRIEAEDRADIERLVRGHRREALVVPARPSRSSGCTRSTPAPPLPRLRAA